MKKFIILIIVCFIVVGGVAIYLGTRDKEEDVSAEDYLAKAEEYLTEREYSKALEQYKLAINTDPSNTDTYLKASEIYVLKTQYDEAIDLLKNGENSVVEVDRVHQKVGDILIIKKDREGAIQYYESAIDKNSNNWEAVVSLVKVYSYFSDRLNDSLKIINGVKTDEKEGIVQVNYYHALLLNNDVGKMLGFLETATASAEGETKDKIESFISVVRKIQSEPDDIVENNTLLAFELIKAELYPYALPVLEKVISENDEYYAAFMYNGICYLNMEDLDKARENLERATSVEPNQIQPWVFLAQVYVLQNNQQDAVNAYEQALTINKDDEEIRYDYAKTLKSFGHYRQARLEYAKLIELNTENVITYKIELAYLDLDHLDEFEEGLNTAKEIVEQWQGFNAAEKELQAEALDLLGWAYYKNSQKDEARKYFLDSINTYKYLAITYYHLGMLYADIGNFTDAEVNLLRAIDLDTEGEVSAKASIELDNLGEEEENEQEVVD